MPFIEEILTCNSVSIVGLEKNTGKTETLNYVLKRLKTMNVPVAVTSIGLDGEETDAVTQTAKPEIIISKGVVFVTSEKHFFQKKVTAEILNVSESQTALGRLITARAQSDGKVILSGPSDTESVRKLISNLQNFGVKTTLVDGALSRMSLASPLVTDAMILATGASVSANMPQLVRKTKFVQRLIELEKVEENLSLQLQQSKNGIWSIGADGEIHDLQIPSVFLLDKRKDDIFRFGNRIYVSGAVSNKLINYLRMQQKKVELIVGDFTKIFVGCEEFDAFLRAGNTIKTLFRNKLIAVTVNPVSPAGITLNSEKLQHAMSEALGLPVYDIKKIEKE